MSDLHRNSRFLRFLRSIRSKTTCVRRAIVALFVAIATVLATFMIMPSASMGASQQSETKQAQTQAEKPENKTAADNKAPAKDGAGVKDGAAAQGESAAKRKAEESKTVEHKNPQPSANTDASNADHTKNVDSEKKQNPAVEDANKNPNKDVKKEESAKKSNRQKRSAKEDDRAAGGNVELPEGCKNAGKGIKFFKDCYVLLYNNSEEKLTLDAQLDGKAENISPAFKMYKDKKKKILVDAVTPSNIVFKLVKLKGNKKNEYIPIPDWVKFKNPDSNDPNSSSDGVIAIYPVGKWTECKQYEFGIQVQYPDYSEKKKQTHSKVFKINVNVKKDVDSNDLELNVYNHENSDPKPSEIDDKTGITFKSGEGGKYSSITPIFIDSKSTKKPGLIYHHMICHKESSSDGSGDSNDNYTVDKVNGLSLGVKNGASGTQTQFAHIENQTKPSTGADAYAVYEKGDDTTERSQSWISGKPEAAGTFTCKVFAVKNVGISNSINNAKTFSTEYFAEYVTNRINANTSAVFENPDTNIYEAHIPNTSTSGLDESVYKPQKTIDWNVKTIKIVFESNNKHLEVKDGDLKLNVYPFKNNDAGSGKPGASASSALADGGTVSAMLGMELKPSIEATSEADSQKAITLKMLCSKGEEPQKTNAGGAGGTSNSDGTSNGVAAGGSGTTGNTDNKGLVYTKWEEPSKLGFTFPDENAQKPCTSKKDKQTCSLEGSTKNFAATTNVSATFKSAEAGDYQCVVYALKPDALTKFNEEAAKTGVTPEKISTAFAGAKLTANKNLAKLTINIHVPEKFTLPHTGEWNWNLQLGAIAAVMVSVLAAGFVASQSDSYRKLFYERRRC
ncbi:hypothetical protein [Gardnerella greenwoodii]|uniref:LPXTG-motif protein cell wall anchor domain protein n=1 Tax=Gardnerella greenwoodii 00703Dmash TaxID=698960 RepID=I4M8C4_9BIFI|nr:hypothetical protein [Gardnerella greenwoodii]EIK85464.1 hypothetical protein CGSMWGv00703Dmash_05334 [Gardnerella greenwoodii 00703Dmash]